MLRARRVRVWGVGVALLSMGLALSVGPAPALAAAVGPKAITILPPGEGDTITVSEFLQNQALAQNAPGGATCDGLGPHTCDQLDMYKNWQFKDGALSPDADHVANAVSSETPIPGVRIVRDNFGVPHIFATGADEQAIEENIGFGVGYAQAEERLFQMEVLRRAGEGTLSELVGPGPNNSYATMDFTVRRDSETDAERKTQIATHLSAGQQASLTRFTDGINAYISYLTTHPDQVPSGFVLTGDLPIPTWAPTDALAIQILEAKQVGESAGNELGYGALARRLKNQYGINEAVGVLNDLQFTDDPLTPVSVPHDQPAALTTDGLHYDYINYTAADTAARINALPASVDAANTAVVSGTDAAHLAARSIGIPQPGSNAWAISPSKSSTGGALLWGAPQVSYYVPQVIDEMEISGGLTHVRGMSVPGGGPAVVIGYTPHISWSITTAQDDQVDTYIDQIRPEDNGTYSYAWRGAWHPVDQRTETIRTRTNGIGPLPSPPAIYTTRTTTMYRTMHGPPGKETPCTVTYIDTAGGVAYCKARSFWGAELDTGKAIVALAQATNVDEAGAALRMGVVGFNFMYADVDGHIAWWHTGQIPVRVAGHDPRLPAPGDGSFDWRGFLDPMLWPHVVDPAQGWIASWNNRPAANWLDGGDGSLWGPTQRVGQPMSLLRAAGKLDQASLWQVAKRTGELDLRDTLGYRPFILQLAARGDLTPTERAAVAEVAAWDGTAFYPDGMEHDSTGAETGKTKYPAFAILSLWFHALDAQVASGVFGPVTGNTADTKAAVLTYTNHSAGSPEFEFFDDYDSFLYNVLAGRTKSGVDYLGGKSVSDVSKAALDSAVSQLTNAQGTDVSAWRADMPQIVFQAVDVSNIPNIPWENRGTWGQAVDFGVSAATAPVATGGMPNTSTGAPWWVVLVVVVLVAGLLSAACRGLACNYIDSHRRAGRSGEVE